MLAFENYQKFYGAYQVLVLGNFEIDHGVYWIQGENGSGKTTFLKTIAGLQNFGGDIVLDQVFSIKKNPIKFRQRVNFAEAEPVFPVFLTGLELISFFASAKKAPEGQVRVLSEALNLHHYIKAPISTYSSGMLKKLSLMLAFLGSPRLILLDEPLITLDTAAIEVLYSWIRDKHEKEQVGFLITSHQSLALGNHFKTKKLIVENRTVKETQPCFHP